MQMLKNKDENLKRKRDKKFSSQCSLSMHGNKQRINLKMVSVAVEKVSMVGTPQREEHPLQSVLKGAFFRTIFVFGGLALVFESARNSLTWHLARFWGSAGDNWQQLWEKTLDVVGYAKFIYKHT
jgi:hypothetical protein